MEKSSTWFEGDQLIDCKLKDIGQSFEDFGEYFRGVVSFMPGMTSVELIEQGTGFVTISTNEGIMKRTNISSVSEADKITVAFDEEYQAGKTLTTNAHFTEEYESKNNQVLLRLKIENLKAPGFMGFFYRTFGRKNIGNAFLEAYKKHFEKSIVK